jgi:hypothetical protein
MSLVELNNAIVYQLKKFQLKISLLTIGSPTRERFHCTLGPPFPSIFSKYD